MSYEDLTSTAVLRISKVNLDLPANISPMSASGMTASGFGIAFGIGLLIGVERERRKGKGPQRAAAGIRTFAIAGLLGAACFQLGGVVLVAVGILALAGFIALSYLRTQQVDPGLTTESALLLTLVLGALAMREPALASAVAVGVTILLAARTSLHRFVRTVLTEQELHDALVLAAAIVVVLPLMPTASWARSVRSIHARSGRLSCS